MNEERDIYLAAEEVAELPEGTRVVITWSGGNGPHEYDIHQCDDDGQTYAQVFDMYRADQWKHHNPITFIGKERFHTRVSIVDTEAKAVTR